MGLGGLGWLAGSGVIDSGDAELVLFALHQPNYGRARALDEARHRLGPIALLHLLFHDVA